MKINNIDIDKIYQAEKELYNNLDLVNKKITVNGNWNFKDDKAQFISSLNSNKGSLSIKSDNPNYLGGTGNYPEPLKYFLLGIASSFVSSFVVSASIKDILLKNLYIEIEGIVNYSYFFSIGNEPKIEEIKLSLTVDSNATKIELMRLKNAAIDCCPALSSLDKSVRVDVKLIFQDNFANSNINYNLILN